MDDPISRSPKAKEYNHGRRERRGGHEADVLCLILLFVLLFSLPMSISVALAV